MTLNSQDSKNLAKCFSLMHRKKLDDAEKLISQGLKEAEYKRDLNLQGLYWSAFGVLHKLKKDFRKAWKCYDQAEKLIPDDPALKIISSRLLIDYFSQYDTVLKKMEKIEEGCKGNTAFLHQIHALMGLAWLKKGDRKKAAEFLKRSMEGGFKGLESSVNLDLKLLEELMKKKVEPMLCKAYLETALKFAQANKEKVFEKLFKLFLKNFPA